MVVTARASTTVLRRAAELGANLVISRQAFLADSQDRPVARPEPALAEKLSLIAELGGEEEVAGSADDLLALAQRATSRT